MAQTKGPRRIARLTPTKIRQAPGPCLLCDGGGLYVKKDGKGHVGRYQYHYTFKGKHHEMTLGSCATIGLDEAREAALKQRKLRSEGIDPLSAKRDRQREESDKGTTFEECGKAYVA